jgi:phosphoribosylanthranilate isomerase
MALRFPVILDRVNNLSDARYGAGMGVYGIVFNMDQSDPKALDRSKYESIKNWLSGVLIGVDFGDTSFQNSVEYAIELGADFLVHAQPDQNVVSSILIFQRLSKPINSVSYSELSGIILESDNLEFLPFDTSIPVYVSNAATFQQNLAGLEQGIFQGIALVSGEELRPGLKNFDEIAEILESLEMED